MENNEKTIDNITDANKDLIDFAREMIYGFLDLKIGETHSDLPDYLKGMLDMTFILENGSVEKGYNTLIIDIAEFREKNNFDKNNEVTFTADQAFEYKKQVDRMQEFYEMMHELSALTKIPLILGIVDDETGVLTEITKLLHDVSHAIDNVLDGSDPKKEVRAIFDIEKMR
ncbi:hypothetical protein [Streptococcus agalactiae]|uniref:hypothetical protein n=1 Tax=Streptococcus agalactiae TaxID=1311 RepID=UPI00085BDC17|nr:hypothetical protein [Streptococcus agalactiae]